MIRQSNDCENFSVYAIGFNNGNLTVDYAITPVDNPPECCVVSRSDKPHSDFRQLWRQLTPIAKRFLEFPLKNEDGNDLHIQVVKVKYVNSKKFGEGYQLTVHLWNLVHSLVPLRVITHKFYAEGVDVNHHADGTGLMTQQVLATERQIFDKLAREAFAYAYYNKREQPTLDEAADAERNGGFADEVGRRIQSELGQEVEVEVQCAARRKK